MDGILNWKKCEKCNRNFDIGTNFDICPDCRNKKKSIELEGRKKQNGKMLEV